MRVVKLTLSYDGTGYCGWQRQENGPTIQEELERAVSLICNSHTNVHGAGRTDAGVHALGMTAHFHTASNISCFRLQKGLNALLPAQIRINDVADKDETFHARFSACLKTYRYAIFTGEIQCPSKRLYTAHYPVALSLSKMRDCLTTITGTHDFASFETSGSRDKTRVTGRGAVRTIFNASLEQPAPDLIHLFFSGDGFLRHMVRNLSGTIIEIGRGKSSVESFKEILYSRDRQKAGATAPAHGLTLMAVQYDD